MSTHERICLWLNSDFSSVMLFSYCYNDRTWLLHSQRSDLFVEFCMAVLFIFPEIVRVFMQLLKRVQGALSAEALLLFLWFSNGWERGSGEPPKEALWFKRFTPLRSSAWLYFNIFCYALKSYASLNIQIKWNRWIRGTITNWSYQILPLCVHQRLAILSTKYFIPAVFHQRHWRMHVED